MGIKTTDPLISLNSLGLTLINKSCLNGTLNSIFTVYRLIQLSYRAGKTNVTHLNDSGHLLREYVKQFDLSWNARAVFSMSKQSESERQKRNSHLTVIFIISIDPALISIELQQKCFPVL